MRESRSDKEEVFYLEAVSRQDGTEVVTDDAALFTDGVNEFWLPKSQIQLEHLKDHDYEVTLPLWLALKKGMI